jgi:hypothetical protein
LLASHSATFNISEKPKYSCVQLHPVAMLRRLQVFARRKSISDTCTPEKSSYEATLILKHTFSTTSSVRVIEQSVVPLSIPIFQVWGSNTDVGKTLVSAGLIHQAAKDGSQVSSSFGSCQTLENGCNRQRGAIAIGSSGQKMIVNACSLKMGHRKCAFV